MNRLEGHIVEFGYENRKVRFFVKNTEDIVQKRHYAGRFYELEELKMIGRFFTHGGVFLDVGANVGNHSIYALKYLGASRAIVIEPNQAAIDILSINIALNGLENQVEASHLGIGLANYVGKAKILEPENNLGGARLERDEREGVPVCTGDALLAGVHVDFIKIDVEGLELQTLAGLANTIAENRPALFVEVDHRNSKEFGRWVDEYDYIVVDQYKRYTWSENFLILPKELPGQTLINK